MLRKLDHRYMGGAIYNSQGGMVLASNCSFNGNKAIEKYDKNQDQYSLMFPVSNRLMVNIEGEKIGLDAVKQAANSLNLKTN